MPAHSHSYSSTSTASAGPSSASSTPLPSGSAKSSLSSSTGSRPTTTPKSVSPSPSIPPLSAPALLRLHTAAGSPDPTRAALEQAQSERAGIRAKNEQLWKLIERQRTGYNQLVEELERARRERDEYKARLLGGGLVAAE
ncbi:hypothetical protein MKEN_00580600 [Mycena kentingensis (nom. inval.)]|nr:hypothetical protein MKEN_00580600 [Mycena kentingensis (nom. inval.)]